MTLQLNKLLTVPVSRKRATLLLALGGYVNTGVLIVQGLLLIPLYLHFVGAHLYGLWMASGGILGMMGMINFGISSMLVQRVASAYGQQDSAGAGAYFINGMFVYMVIVFVFTIAGMLLSLGLPALLKTSDAGETLLIHCFQLAVLATGVGILNECLRGFANALLRPLFSVMAMAVFRIFGIAATVFLLYRNAGLWAIPAGMLMTELLILASGLIQAGMLFRGLHAKVMTNNSIIKEYFHVGGALIMGRLGHVLSRESDPLLIALILRPEATTAYMVTRRAADMVFQILSVIYGSTHSAFSHLAGQENDSKTAEIATQFLKLIFIFGLIGFVLYVGMNHSFVSLWVGETFALDQKIVLCIGVAFFASSLRNMVLQTLNGLGDFEYSSRIILLEGVGRVVLSASLLGLLGVVGAPLSLVVASSITALILGVKLNGRVQLILNKQDYVKAIILVLVLFGLAEMLARHNDVQASWMQFILIAVALMLVTTLICVFVYWTPFRKVMKGYRVWR